MSVYLVLCAEISWPLASFLAYTKSQHIINTIIVINESESSQQANNILNKENPKLEVMH